jgi:hypothetical protein
MCPLLGMPETMSTNIFGIPKIFGEKKACGMQAYWCGAISILVVKNQLVAMIQR